MQEQITQLESVKQSFDHWRSTRTKQSKIPLHLWQQVDSLLDTHPLGTITRTLGINKTQIKENLSHQPKVNFVEVPAPTQPALLNEVVSIGPEKQTCSIELTRPCGSILKVSELPVAMVSQLIPEFIGR